MSADVALAGASTRLPCLAGRILKVDHAGEHGAVCLYTGQLHVARISSKGLAAQLRQFRSHEMRHREIFAGELRRRGVRRCRSYWLCGVGGYVLGITTALLGAQAIFATTVAVERVVLRHLEHQREALRDDPGAVEAIEMILADEREHHDSSQASLMDAGRRMRSLMSVVSTATEGVIWLGMRL